MLDEVVSCFREIVCTIADQGERVIVIADPDDSSDISFSNELISVVKCPTNDTWARDTCSITTLRGNRPVVNDFKFNGWGLKFAADKDNLITSRLFDSGMFKGEYSNSLNFVLEGGSIESDGKGTLLTTSECLLSKNRNGQSSKEEIQAYLEKVFGISRVLWLDHGYLSGDDTDSHVDTLARLCPDHTITYVQCLDKDDEHYGALRSMEDQLKTFRTLEGDPYRLLPLPMPEAIYDEDGQRLPATYANFLIMNEAVLYPTYAQPANDARAAQVLAEAFPGREIVGVDCRALIQQHGSLHCVTMQYPESVKNDIES